MSSFLAEVHKNELGTLYVHTPLLEKTFGVQPRKGQGRCLITQVAYSIHAVFPKIAVSRIVTHVDKHVTRKIGEDGHLINEILDTFRHPVKVDTGHLALNLSLGVVQRYDELIHDMLIGQPVMVVIDSDVCAVLQDEARAYGDGEIRSTVIRHGQTGKYHVMLAMGFDLAGYVILRDSRSTYAHKGYVKIATNLLQDGWRFLTALTVNVHGAQNV